MHMHQAKTKNPQCSSPKHETCRTDQFTRPGLLTKVPIETLASFELLSVTLLLCVCHAIGIS